MSQTSPHEQSREARAAGALGRAISQSWITGHGIQLDGLVQSIAGVIGIILGRIEDAREADRLAGEFAALMADVGGSDAAADGPALDDAGRAALSARLAGLMETRFPVIRQIACDYGATPGETMLYLARHLAALMQNARQGMDVSPVADQFLAALDVARHKSGWTSGGVQIDTRLWQPSLLYPARLDPLATDMAGLIARASGARPADQLRIALVLAGQAQRGDATGNAPSGPQILAAFVRTCERFDVTVEPAWLSPPAPDRLTPETLQDLQGASWPERLQDEAESLVAGRFPDITAVDSAARIAIFLSAGAVVVSHIASAHHERVVRDGIAGLIVSTRHDLSGATD